MSVAYLTQQIVGTASTGTYSTLYSTGGATTAIISGLHICNESTSEVTVRIGLKSSAGTPASGEFIAYDLKVPALKTVPVPGPFTLGNTTYLRVSSSATTVTFTAATAEIS